MKALVRVSSGDCVSKSLVNSRPVGTSHLRKALYNIPGTRPLQAGRIIRRLGLEIGTRVAEDDISEWLQGVQVSTPLADHLSISAGEGNIPSESNPDQTQQHAITVQMQKAATSSSPTTTAAPASYQVVHSPPSPIPISSHSPLRNSSQIPALEIEQTRSPKHGDAGSGRYQELNRQVTRRQPGHMVTSGCLPSGDYGSEMGSRRDLEGEAGDG